MRRPPPAPARSISSSASPRGSLVVKTNIDAVSGATVTTKGITKGANAALAAAEAMA